MKGFYECLDKPIEPYSECVSVRGTSQSQSPMNVDIHSPRLVHGEKRSRAATLTEYNGIEPFG